MARYSIVNIAMSANHAIWHLKETLKEAGWTVKSSGDGNSLYSSSGDVLTAPSNMLYKCWFRISDPGDSHEWCFQMSNTISVDWRVKISSLDRFTGGSPDFDTVPSAVDEQIIIGGGTDASPTYAELFIQNYTFYAHIIVESTPIGTACPVYGFWFFTTRIGTGEPSTIICQEPMKIGSFPELSSGTRVSPVVGDPDPVMYVCSYHSTGYNFWANGFSASGTWNSGTSSTNPPKYWYKMNYGTEGWTSGVAACFYVSTFADGRVSPFHQTYWQSGAGTDKIGRDVVFPLIIGRPVGESTYVGLKGVCNYMKLRSINRKYPSVINLYEDARVYVGDFLIPWPNGVLPVV